MGYQRRVHGDSSLESQVELTESGWNLESRNQNEEFFLKMLRFYYKSLVSVGKLLSYQIPVLKETLKVSSRCFAVSNIADKKSMFYGIEFFYDEDSRKHKCELKMDTVIYTGYSTNKEEAYNQAKTKYLKDLEEAMKQPETDILLDMRSRHEKRSGCKLEKRWLKSDGSASKDQPFTLDSKKYESFNFGTATKPIIYHRGKRSVQKYKNFKKRKRKIDSDNDW